MNFTIAFAARGPAVLLELHGEFDLEAVPVFESVMRDQLGRGCRLLVLDFDALQFIDSGGIYAVIEMLRAARSERSDVRFVLTNQRIARVFELSGIDRALRFFPNRAAALAAS
ncbi:MAG: STAS domain-containing protein [Candidatus Eremiobacteraeota bacterium]|nr:STAS domain-containing protein [Candidatus Eremiobacteraeota bacterium]